MKDKGVDMWTCDALCFVPKKYFQHQKQYLVFVLRELGLIFKSKFSSVEAEWMLWPNKPLQMEQVEIPNKQQQWEIWTDELVIFLTF